MEASGRNIRLVTKRDGCVVAFDRRRVFSAIERAFLSCGRVSIDVITSITDDSVGAMEQLVNDGKLTVEAIQDLVETALMKKGHYDVAKRYILYREQHKRERLERVIEKIKRHKLFVCTPSGQTEIFDPMRIEDKLRRLSRGLGCVSVQEIADNVAQQVYDRIQTQDIDQLLTHSVRERIETHYDYSYLCSRLTLDRMYNRILSVPYYSEKMISIYRTSFRQYIQKGMDLSLLSPDINMFDLDQLANSLIPQRDQLFMYLGIQILADRYLLRERDGRNVFELPQWFWMRVAMGIASVEKADKNEHAIEFYTVLSQMDLVSSTPTLFNSATVYSQMSSCYLNTVSDSLDDIFKIYSDNAKLSKWAGGIGTDWTPIRATGSPIKGTNGVSQGVIPFIKIFNDVALAVNQGGKRKGAMCGYMETWHLDFEQFLELKKNTGDERRRAHRH